jgi:ATP-dependent 26S proteasome regulatory subunit
MRPGRIDRKIYVPPPDLKARIQILKINLAKVPCAPDVNIEELATKVKLSQMHNSFQTASCTYIQNTHDL